MLYRAISDIVARHQGHAWKISDPDTLVLDRVPETLAMDNPDDEAPLQQGATAQASGSPRLLIVEDDWFVGMDIEATLTDHGYTVVEVARSAEDAVRAALRHTPDLVLMDIRLLGPGDGVEAAHAIREQAGIPCLFVSAHTDEATRNRAEGARPAGWLVKPFLTQHLLEAVRQALGAGDEAAGS